MLQCPWGTGGIYFCMLWHPCGAGRMHFYVLRHPRGLLAPATLASRMFLHAPVPPPLGSRIYAFSMLCGLEAFSGSPMCLGSRMYACLHVPKPLGSRMYAFLFSFKGQPTKTTASHVGAEMDKRNKILLKGQFLIAVALCKSSSYPNNTNTSAEHNYCSKIEWKKTPPIASLKRCPNGGWTL